MEPLGFITSVISLLRTAIAVIKSRNNWSRWLDEVLWRLPAMKWVHARFVRNQLHGMPFIYNDPILDLELNVPEDYVPATFIPLDLKTLAPQGAYDESCKQECYPSDAQETIEHQFVAANLIRSRNRVLVLGAAGIGKSTLLRRAALERVRKLNPMLTRDLFDKPDTLIPFFIPLKAVDTGVDFPVLTYLLTTFPYLRGRLGFRRLLRLAAKKRLLLLLDGYDEAVVRDPKNTAFQEELAALLRLNAPARVRGDKRLEDFYYALRECNVWLSSRKEFYASHTLLKDADGYMDQYDTWLAAAFNAVKLRVPINKSNTGGLLPTIEVTGIQHTDALVERIIQKYRSSRQKIYTALSSADFFRWAEREFDEDTSRLQSNPLFLTTMCYLYARSHIKGALKTHWQTLGQRHSLRELIMACVWALLKDVDEGKVRNLERGKTLMRVRLLHTSKKVAFLQYFAARLFYDERFSDQQVFTRETLQQAVLEFAQEKRWGRKVKEPIERRSRTSLIEILIEQGLFVVVERSPLRTTFDFPHQRFREVLAVEYLDNAERSAWILDKVADRRFGELLKVFFALSKSYQRDILIKILQNIDSADDGYFIRLAVSCMDNAPRHFDPQPELMRWLKPALQEGRISDISAEFARHCILDADLSRWIPAELQVQSRAGRSEFAFDIGTVLFRVDAALFERTLLQMAISDHEPTRKLARQLAAVHESKLLFKLIAVERQDAYFKKISQAAESQDPTTIEFWRLVFEILSDPDIGEIRVLASRFGSRKPDLIRAVQLRLSCLSGFQRYLTQQFPSLQVEHLKMEDAGQERLRLSRPLNRLRLTVIFKAAPQPDEVTAMLESRYAAWEMRTSEHGICEVQFAASLSPTSPPAQTEYQCEMVRHYLMREFPERSITFDIGEEGRMYFAVDTDHSLEIGFDRNLLDSLQPADIDAWCDRMQILGRLRKLPAGQSRCLFTRAGCLTGTPS